jgi:hypothetical protein
VSGEQRLLAHLRAVGRAKVGRVAILEAFHAASPAEASGPDARRLLAEQLPRLKEQGELELPGTKAGWDLSVRPALPEWVKVRTEARAVRSRWDHRAVAWAPELAFVSELERVEDREALLRLQRFFAEGGHAAPMVPVRERSVAIPGDEKRLEKLARTALFGAGRLSYELLRCFPVASPLVWEAGPPGGTSSVILVVESHHTWHSFCRWNREAAAYAAVVYGAGNAFVSSVEYLLDVIRETGAGEVHYFGDLDREGLLIVQRALERVKALCASSLPDIQPAVAWYRTLIERGREVFGWHQEASPGEPVAGAGASAAGAGTSAAGAGTFAAGAGTSAVAAGTSAAGAGASGAGAGASAAGAGTSAAGAGTFAAGAGTLEPFSSPEPSMDTSGPGEEAWLPPELQRPVRLLLSQERRLPQELVGWEQLMTHTSAG